MLMHFRFSDRLSKREIGNTFRTQLMVMFINVW